MYALIVRFEVKAGRIDEFDALVEEALVGIRAREPGTPLYLTSTTDGDPNARIFIEIYEDEQAFQEHENAPHMQRFLQSQEVLTESIRVEIVRPTHGKFPDRDV